MKTSPPCGQKPSDWSRCVFCRNVIFVLSLLVLLVEGDLDSNGQTQNTDQYLGLTDQWSLIIDHWSVIIDHLLIVSLIDWFCEIYLSLQTSEWTLYRQVGDNEGIYIFVLVSHLSPDVCTLTSLWIAFFSVSWRSLTYSSNSLFCPLNCTCLSVPQSSVLWTASQLSLFFPSLFRQRYNVRWSSNRWGTKE